MGGALCCCRLDGGNPDERKPLVDRSKTPQSKFMNKEGSFSRSILASAITPGQLLDPELEEIINIVSSGDEDDPIDPQDEAKYEEILKGIED